jgi:hypothetical protein
LLWPLATFRRGALQKSILWWHCGTNNRKL